MDALHDKQKPASSAGAAADSHAVSPLPPCPDSTVIMPDGSKRIALGSGEITAFLGQGGMANVYEIWNSQLEVSRAVKLINPNSNRSARERFQTEIKITAKLHHPNITEIYGVGQWQGVPYIEMEKLEGMGLERILHERGALPAWVCTSIGIMIGRALKYAHDQEYTLYGKKYTGIVHRDLKPSNIMVCGNGTVKLMDFGIASPTEASFHTVAGTVLGTLQYLAPEQLENKKLDCSSDIYALGTTMYEILTGQMAFDEPGVHKLMLDKLRGRFKPLSEYRIKAPVRLKRLIQKCMQQDPERRVRSAGAFLRELGRIHSSLTSESPEQTMRRFIASAPSERVVVPTRPVWPVRIAVGLLAAVACGVGVWYLAPLLERDAPTIDPPTATRPSSSEESPQEVVELETPGTDDTAVGPVKAAAGQGEAKPVRAVKKALATPAPAIAQAAPAPTPSVASQGTPRQSFVEQVREEHGTDDLLAIFKREVKAGRYAKGLRVYAHLGRAQQSSTDALLIKMRALSGAGNKKALSEFMDSVTINDGEYYLVKGRVAYENGRYLAARQALDKSLAAPRLFVDYDYLKREVSYYQALCATARFDQKPGNEHYQKAMEEWWRLKSLLRAEPNHAYNARVIDETQRIGRAFRQMETNDE